MISKDSHSEIMRPIKTYGRRISRSLTPNKKDLLSFFMPKLSIDLDADFSSMRKKFQKINLEIGFGNGGFLFEQVVKFPEQLFIGSEPFQNGIADLLNKFNIHNIDNIPQNVFIYDDDARILLNAVPNYFFDSIYIICPDPWPKRKHHKRRILNKNMFELLSKKILLKTGVLKIITDHADYAQWILERYTDTSLFNETFRKLEDFIVRFDEPCKDEDRFLTKYQLRGIAAGHKIYCFELMSFA
jgi:tRNA (guanine-N7-)-methyltransferase